MPTSSQFKIITTLEQKRRAQPVWPLGSRDPVVHLSGTDSPVNISDDNSAYHTNPTPKCLTSTVASRTTEYSSKTARLTRHSSCFNLGARVPEKYDNSENPSKRSLGTGNKPASHTAAEHAATIETIVESPQESLFIAGEEPTTQSEDTTNTSGEFKNLLYGLGFRGMPGEKDREDINCVFKQRPGLLRKVNKTSMEKAEEPVVITGITTEPVQTIDINSINPGLLKPTALCFDTNGLEISHKELKAALDKVLIHCDGAEIRMIQFENRRLKESNLPNRWMIYTDSQDSRNTICGRQLTFGERYVVLRRYDDLVLLAHKKALRAEAWKKVLGRK